MAAQAGRRHGTRLGAFALAGAITGLSGAPAQAEPWRLEEALGAPDWLKIEGEARIRYESLGGQFRAGREGGDQILVSRTLLLVEADAGPVAFGIEGQDSRAELDDAGTPLSTSIVNPADILQAYVRFDLENVTGLKRADLTLGRQTVSISSKRVIERVEFANVIFSYTGALFSATNAGGDEFYALYVSPTTRLPSDRTALGDNDLSGDEEAWGRRIWGAHARFKDALGARLPGVWAEAFLYGLNERDTSELQTPNRDYLQPGVRVYRAPKPGQIDFELEASYRNGSRRSGSSTTDTRDLDVSAATVHAHAGFSFEDALRTNLRLDLDYASGDENPNDDRFDQFERLFGSRRTDLGNTSLHGPLTPANLFAPGGRIEITPTQRFDARLAYKAAFLASATDRWVIANVRDPSGASGDFIGHAIDARARYALAPGNLLLEVGASALLLGEFAETAPNASGQGDALFGYVQLTQTF